MEGLLQSALGPDTRLTQFTHTNDHASFSQRMGSLLERLDQAKTPPARAASRTLRALITKSHDR